MPENLMEGLFSEMIRVKEIVVEYEHPSLKGSGQMAAFIMKHSISNAEQAIANMNISNMVRCFSDLKDYTL